VVGAAAGFHSDQAAWGQLQRAPSEELLARQRFDSNGAACLIDGMHLYDVFGKVNPYPNDLTSCNLSHGLPLSSWQIDGQISILVLRHRLWEVGSPFVFTQ
jgi:hypothetical protein